MTIHKLQAAHYADPFRPIFHSAAQQSDEAASKPARFRRVDNFAERIDNRPVAVP
jgi:hypothetical protein